MDAPSSNSSSPLLHVCDVTKRYPGAVALSQVSFELRGGEVHGLIGPNGAGKTTLVSIIAGVEHPDAGEVLIQGHRVEEFSPLTAAAMGVAVVPQRPDLFPSLSVLDNLFVGMWPKRFGLLDWSEMRRRGAEVMDRLGINIPLAAKVGLLSLADRQMVQIARALLHQACVFIFDEPTAPLTHTETARLLSTVAELKQAGHGVIYITHRLPELFGLTDRVTLLKDGQVVATLLTSHTDEEELVRLMAGEARPSPSQPRSSPGELLLVVRDLCVGKAIGPVSFELRRGEILGLTGLAGSGAEEVARALSGALPFTGELLIGGVCRNLTSVQAAQQAGVYLLPSDRHGESLFLGMSVRENITLTALRGLTGCGGWVDRRREQAVANEYASRLAVRLASIEQEVDTLSGGNQQKVAFARLLAARPMILVSVEPTQGVDVGARQEIHRLLRQLSAEGMGLLVVAGDTAELQRLCDRVLVMHRGQIVTSLSAAQATEETILSYAGGIAASQPSGTAETKSRSLGPSRDPHTEPQRTFLPWSREWTLVCFVLFLVTLVGGLNPHFLSPDNLRDLASNASHVLVVALAMTMVILTGNIDISVGSALGLCAAAGAGLAVSGWPLWAVILLTLSLGGGLGLLNSAVVVGLRLPSIIVTLGALSVYRGLLIHLTGGKWITGLPATFRALALHRLAGIPLSVIMAAAVAVATAFALRYTAWGRCVYLCGDNHRSAQRLGLRGAVITTSVLVLVGCATGLASLMFAARFSAVQSNAGLGFEMLVITCAVVGGADILGGRGSVFGTVLGVLLVTILGNALTLLQLSAYWDKAAQGALVLAAVCADALGRRRRPR